MKDNDQSPTPDPVSPLERMQKGVAELEAKLLHTVRVMSGHKLTLEQTRTNHRADPEDVYSSAQNYRSAENDVQRLLNQLVSLHEQTMIQLANEKITEKKDD